MRFIVQKREDIFEKIIPHFSKYKLLTSKQLNFESFKKAVRAGEIIARGEHLKLEGLT